MRLLPPIWSRANPVDIVGRCGRGALCGRARSAARRRGQRRRAGHECADGARQRDCGGQGRRGRDRSASATSGHRRSRSFAVWIGEEAAGLRSLRERRHSALRRQKPTRSQGFMHLVRYREAQDNSDGDAAQPAAGDFVPDVVDGATRSSPASCRMDARGSIRSRSNALLCGLCDSRHAGRACRDSEEAATAAQPLLAEGGTVVVKILSPDIVHKSEVGGVQARPHQRSGRAHGCRRHSCRAPRRFKPDARITGVTVQPMVRCGQRRAS